MKKPTPTAVSTFSGKTPICWNDALLAQNIPENVVVQYWTIDYAKEMADFVQKGGKWIYSDMFELYLDYPHSMIPLKKVYEFQPHLYKYAIPKGDGLMGFEACCWTEHIETEEELCRHIFPRIYALSERFDHMGNHTLHPGDDYETFKKSLAEKLKLLKEAGIPYTPEEWWDPKGKVRRDDAIQFYLNMGAGVDEEEKRKQAASAAPKLPFVLHFIKEFFKICEDFIDSRTDI